MERGRAERGGATPSAGRGGKLIFIALKNTYRHPRNVWNFSVAHNPKSYTFQPKSSFYLWGNFSRIVVSPNRCGRLFFLNADATFGFKKTFSWPYAKMPNQQETEFWTLKKLQSSNINSTSEGHDMPMFCDKKAPCANYALYSQWVGQIQIQKHQLALVNPKGRYVHIPMNCVTQRGRFYDRITPHWV